jgi:hypothetical protein
MKRDSMIFYRSFYESVTGLSPVIKAELYDAIFEYGLNFQEIEFTNDISKALFTLIKPQLDANIKRFENGKKPKTKQSKSETGAKDKQKASKVEANNNVNNNVNNNDNNIVPFQERVNGFLNWFNSEFVKHGKQQAKFRTLNNQTESNLKKLLDKYSTDEWNYAFENMIKSEWVIENKNATPDHFLRPANFEKYLNQPKQQEEKFNLPHLR